MIVHVISETAFVTKGQGVHTAFVELVELLKSEDDITVVVNNEGFGDVLHSQTYGPYYRWIGRKYKGRRIHTVHVIPDSIKGSLVAWKFLMPLVRAYLKMVFSYSDMLIALSPMVEDAIRALGVTTPIARISNPVMAERWKRTAEKRAAGRAMLGLAATDRVVLGVGQLQDRKGVEDFIDVGEAIPDATFIWVGGRPFGAFTGGIDRIDERIRAASRNIRFAGLHDLQDMPAIYAAADIFLFPSYQENCPLAPLEAAACGMPVIYRDLEEYRRLYTHPYLKAAGSPDFVAMIRRLLDDPDYFADANRLSAALILQFDKRVIRSELIQLYTQVLEKARADASHDP